MSLNKQMMLFIASMLLILLAGTFALNLSNTKSFLQDQLSSHAQDTATSLGLSLSTNADIEDLSTMETMINAVFDRGYYADITLRDREGNILYQRLNPKKMDAVPTWFIELIDLKTPQAEAIVQSGWFPVGRLYVTSHAGYAYIELWQAALNLSLWFGLAALLAIALVITALHFMLKPLRKMEKQAEAIVKKEYLIQRELPSTTEFRQVVGAMNVMVRKMKEVFERDAKTAEKLQKMAYQDSVTGLSNRRHFEMVIDSRLDLKDDNSPGLIALIRIHNLKELNDQYGYLIGDQFVKTLADTLCKTLEAPHALFARLNGTELVALLPSASAKTVTAGLELVCTAVPDFLADVHADEAPTSISAAFMNYQPGETRPQLLSCLDYAIEQSSKQGVNSVYFYEKEGQTEEQSRLWQDRFDKAAKEDRFLLYQQGTFAADGELKEKEVLVRLKDEDGVVHSAGFFMPAIKQAQKVKQLDELVLHLVFKHLRQHYEPTRLSVNLTRSIIQNPPMQHWLLEVLEGVDGFRNKLAFEFSETLASENLAQTQSFMQTLRSMGILIGIDHFGGSANLHYLKDLKPDYVKLNSAFSKGIEGDEQTHSYVASLYEMAQSLDIDVIAMSIETESQMKAFEKLGITPFQGYYYGAPAPLEGHEPLKKSE